ncbi:MAG TPA: GTP-binding protein, partial [Candidatus Polarisedimenticolia bacterium]|nr:GTP-binding protein [Candidatus Polarisedimenticolia bacterium]
GIRRRGQIGRGAEALSVLAAGKNIVAADVVLVVADATDAPTQQDLHVAGLAIEEGRPFAVLLNKWDLLTAGERPPEMADPDQLVTRVRGRLKFAPHAPILTLSALTGLHVSRVLPLVDAIHAQATRTLTTGRLNTWLRSAVTKHRAPAVRGKDLKFYYIAQKASNPPAFLLFTNQSHPPHFSYQRYLENSLRETFDLTLTPVILSYRERPRQKGGSKASRTTQAKRRV